MSNKKDGIDTPKKKKGCLQGCFSLIIILIAFGVIIGACFGDEDKEEAEITTNDVKESTQQESLSWQDKVDEVTAIDGTAGEKFDAISRYAMDYPVTAEEKDAFLADIIAEYKEGKYIADLTNDKYMLTNLFKSQAIDVFYDDQDVNAEQDFAFDFWQNSKYTYRGVDAVDSDAVKSNERQMDKALAKLNK